MINLFFRKNKVIKTELQDVQRLPDEPDIERIIKTLGIKSGELIGHVGCLDTKFLLPLQSAVSKKGKLYEIDHRFDALDAVEKIISEKDVKGVETLISSEVSIPLADEFLDGIIVTHFIHTLRRPLRFIFELKRILKKSGFLYILEGEGGGFAFFKKKRNDKNVPYPSVAAIQHLKKAHFFNIQKRHEANKEYSIITKKK